jgi:hypothetical protein
MAQNGGGLSRTACTQGAAARAAAAQSSAPSSDAGGRDGRLRGGRERAGVARVHGMTGSSDGNSRQLVTRDGYILGYEARLNPLKLGAG